MATEIVQFRYCDHHLAAKDERIPGEEWTISLAPPGERGRTFTLDACSECAEPFRELLSHLETEARPVKGTRRPVSTGAEPSTTTRTEYPCPADGCGHVVFTRQGLQRHVREIHGTTLAALEGVAESYVCPDCGAAFTSPQGVGVHRKRIHPETFVSVNA